jgi:protein phosphatase
VPDVVTHGSICLRSGAATSAGNRRRLNEDAHGTSEHLCVVADGMGGHAAGEVASAVAIDTITRSIAPSIPRSVHPRPTLGELSAAVGAANAAILDRAARDGTAGMGTTLVGACVIAADDGDDVAVVHVGDSRCYRLRDGVLDLLTRDHSLVQELVDAGRLSPFEAASHPMGNIVTRALGAADSVEATVALIGATACRLLLCSDGLSDELSARTIGRVLAGVAGPQDAADRLLEIALAGPARDNVTAVVIDVVVDDCAETDRTEPDRTQPDRTHAHH